MGELPRGHGKVISRSQQGQISSKRLKIPLFLSLSKIVFTSDVYDGSKHFFTQTRTYAKTPQEVTEIIQMLEGFLLPVKSPWPRFTPL